MKTIKDRQSMAVPMKIWDGAGIAENAIDQMRNVATLPFVHHHVALMADGHLGKGATVGAVIATKSAVIPAAVGVDLGCGMMAQRTTLRAEDLPDNLTALRTEIEAAIPHGGPGRHGSWQEDGRHGPPGPVARAWAEMATDWDDIADDHPLIRRGMTEDQLGTLGGGNHFIEICLDLEGYVWIMLHSGSRGVGNRIGTYFIDKAKEEMKRFHVHLPDTDLAYLPEGSTHFADYVLAVGWAQEFARVNRVLMMERCLNTLRHMTGSGFGMFGMAVNCHHNYIAIENHYGENVYVTRKGAVRARLGDLGIIPGSMGAKSFIVRGKGSPESFQSCSHGAGRVMSRGEARKKISMDAHKLAVVGVECRTDEAVIDESPAAYKDIDAVMAAQADLVEVVYELKQIVCVKG